MIKFKYCCNECDSEFIIQYDPDECDTDPGFCSFCGSLMMIDDEIPLVDE